MKVIVGVGLGVVVGIGAIWLAPQLGLERAAARDKAPSRNGDANGDGSVNVADAIYLLSYIFARGPAPEAIPCDSCCPQCAGRGLPATGQKTCYDDDGNVISCDSAEWPGQDAAYRAGCPREGRFADNGDGTVRDNCTGLLWQKAIAAGMHDWQEALKYCDGLELAGFSDWRLPNAREIYSLADLGAEIGIDPVFEAVAGEYWSSSTYGKYLDSAWIGFFSEGGGSLHIATKNVRAYVRAVRGGP